MIDGHTAGKIVQLAAALCGAAGTTLLYLGSFRYIMTAGYANEEFLRKMSKRNKRRLTLQRVGLECLMLSFLFSAVSVFTD